jgi:hypothetical protein
MKAACHCGAVRFEIAAPPTWVLDCNCTLCRRYGALWAYTRGLDPRRAPQDAIEFTMLPNGPTDTYVWGDESLAFHRCKACGCLTHMAAADVDPPVVYGVNARMMVGLDPAKVRVRQVDNGHSGFFWTQSPDPPIKSRHPYMPPPGPDDWR